MAHQSSRLLLGALSTLIVCSAAAVIHLAASSVTIEEMVLTSGVRQPLRVILFHPSAQGTPRPAIVAVPPYYIPWETMEIICVEAARRGAECAVPDFFGKSPGESRQRMSGDALSLMSADVGAVVAMMRSRPSVDPARIGVCGHSVGGSVAAEVGRRDDQLRTTVAIGMVADVNRQRPRNTLFLAGLFDEMHAPRELLANLRDSGIAADPRPGVTYGDFADGTARAVQIIPTADHTIETSEPLLIRVLLDWFARTLDAPGLGGGVPAEWLRRMAAFLLVSSAIVLYALLVGSAAERTLQSRIPRFLAMRIHLVQLLGGLALLWLAGSVVEIQRYLVRDLMAAVILGHELVGFRIRSLVRGEPRAVPRRGLAALFALWAGVVIAFGIVAIPSYVQWPSALLWYPVFALNMGVLFGYSTWLKVTPWLFSATTNAVTPSLIMGLIILVTVVWPGVIVEVFDRLGTWAIQSARGQVVAGGPRSGAHERLKIIALAGLICLLAFLVYRRSMEGMMTTEGITVVGGAVLKFIIPPFIATVLVLRSRVVMWLAGEPSPPRGALAAHLNNVW